jgi:hypothetical protein
MLSYFLLAVVGLHILITLSTLHAYSAYKTSQRESKVGSIDISFNLRMDLLLWMKLSTQNIVSSKV